MDRGRINNVRGRIVTSCSHCYRRKQKCDRRRPCNNCTARKVGHECHYDLTPSKPYQQHTTRPPADRGIPAAASGPGPSSQPSRQSFTAQDQLGYSKTSESNSFVESSPTLHHGRDHERSTALLILNGPSWQTYWNYVRILPSETTIDDLLNAYFSEINWINGLVEAYYFKAFLNDWRISNRNSSGSSQTGNLTAVLGCFPGTLFQILATTIQFLPAEVEIEGLPNKDRMLLSQEYSDSGAGLVQLLGHQGFTITAIQHDMLRAVWLKNRGRGAEAWHALGSSIRKSQELNFHRHESLQNPSPETFWYSEWKKRIWITQCVWDSNMSMILGRPRLLNVVDCDAHPPIDSEISDITGMHLSHLPTTQSSLKNTPSSISVRLLMYSLSQTVHEIRNHGADKRGLKEYSLVQQFETSIFSTIEALPPALRSPNPDTTGDLIFPLLPRQREQILSITNTLLIALHRPHVRKHERSREMCIQAAFNVLESQQRFFDVLNRYHYSYFGNAFFSIEPMIVLATAVTEFPITDMDILQRVLDLAQQALGRLSLIERANELALVGIKIIRACYQVIKDAYSRLKYADVHFQGFQSAHTQASRSPEKQEEDILNHHHQQVPVETTFPPQNPNHMMSTSFGYAGDAAMNMHMQQPVEMDFMDYMTPMEQQSIENEFDVSYWMGYRQIMVDDATYETPANEDVWNPY